MNDTLFYNEPRRKLRPAALAGILAGLLLIGAVLVFALFSGGGAPEPDLPVAASSGTAGATLPQPAPTEPPTETFEVFESKDPFRPLVLPASAGSTGGTTGTTPGGTTTTSAGSGAAGGPAPSGGQQVTLLDIFSDAGTNKAQVKVGSTVHTVAVGGTFATNFKLVSINGNCATLLHGDDKFTLCEGDQVFK